MTTFNDTFKLLVKRWLEEHRRLHDIKEVVDVYEQNDIYYNSFECAEIEYKFTVIYKNYLDEIVHFDVHDTIGYLIQRMGKYDV